MPVVNEPNRNDAICEAETIEDISEAEVVEDICMAEKKNSPKKIMPAQPISKVLMTFIRVRQKNKRKKLDTIHEYLLYIMSPFVYEEDMDEFCTDFLQFTMDHNYRPKISGDNSARLVADTTQRTSPIHKCLRKYASMVQTP